MNTADYETGYDDQIGTSVVLPDRVTHVTVKGEDHPSIFAKGAPDETPGGIYWGCAGSAAVTTAVSTEGMVSSCSEGWEKEVVPPAGWRALKPEEDFEGEATVDEESDPSLKELADAQEQPFTTAFGGSKRLFFNDSSLRFIAAEEWAGSKPGMVFRLGSLGLGYYEDISLEELMAL